MSRLCHSRIDIREIHHTLPLRLRLRWRLLLHGLCWDRSWRLLNHWLSRCWLGCLTKSLLLLLCLSLLLQQGLLLLHFLRLHPNVYRELL